MKKLIFLLFFTPLFLCGDCSGDQDQKLADQRLDDLFQDSPKLPETHNDSVAIDMGGIEEIHQKTVVKVETTADNRQRIILYLPEVQDGPHIGKLTLNVILKADTVQEFALTASSVKTLPTKNVDAAKPKNSTTTFCGVIQPGDTKYKISSRLSKKTGIAIKPAHIMNKEPLQLGEPIRVKQ